MEFEKGLSVTETGIPGLLLCDLAVHGDSRGWFKENWQREKMCALGVPDRRWVQNNISFNDKKGVTRGIHAEPWDKWVSVACGSVFGAWVDLREGSPTFGEGFTATLDPSRAIYVPRGVGNSYQALEDDTAYTYLVDAHWAAELKPSYTFVNLSDPQLSIKWPIPLNQCELSDADRSHPMLADVVPMPDRRTLVTGANGQLGSAVRATAIVRGLTTFDYTDVDEFDISDSNAYGNIDWGRYGYVINCGAYTAVDSAETKEGRVAAWRANAIGPMLLAHTCAKYGITLVHISSDSVFDGKCDVYDEMELLSPLSVYGQSKAAGELAVQGCPNYYIVRTSWMIDDSEDCIRAMTALSDRCADPSDVLTCVSVANNQQGRPTFADQIAEGILWLIGYREGNTYPSAPAASGIYNLTSSGKITNCYEVARQVFELRNGNGNAVVSIGDEESSVAANQPLSIKSFLSNLGLSKIEATGFCPRDWRQELAAYIASLPHKEA